MPASYFRTSAQAEIDLVLEGPRRRVVAVEVKRTAAPKVEKGFRLGCEEVGARERFYVVPQTERHPLGHGSEAIGIVDLIRWLNDAWKATAKS
jgi:predicted AAA+ superfamily ATPase